jgi:hypothetical protein
VKLKALAIAVSLPLVAAIVVLTVSPRRDSPIQPATGDSARSSDLTAPEATESSLPPEWLTAPLPDPFGPDSDAPGADSPDEDLPSVGDRQAMVRKALVNILEENGQAPYTLDLHFGLDNLRSHPALPGVSGFEVLDCAPHSNCPSDRLVEESDDARWARPMEARIMGALAAHSNEGIAQEYVVCRRTVCGIVLPVAPGAEHMDIYALGKQLVEDLGFDKATSWFVAPDEHFQTLYLEKVREP